MSISENDIELSVYPNPATEFINIKSNTLIKHVSLFDYAGKLVFENIENNKNLVINTTDLERGGYIIVFEIGEQKIQEKIIIE
jgi:hypothetical protein